MKIVHLLMTAMVVGALGAAAYAQQQAAPSPAAATPLATTAEAVTQVFRRGSGTASAGGAANFTGQVNVQTWFRAAGSQMGGATVTFSPGARSAWHAHGKGQLLVVTDGCGWTQVRGGAIERVCAGDVVWAAPGQVHWHGATATTAMSHVAVSESGEGASVRWLEQVSDEDYRKGPPA